MPSMHPLHLLKTETSSCPHGHLFMLSPVCCLFEVLIMPLPQRVQWGREGLEARFDLVFSRKLAAVHCVLCSWALGSGLFGMERAQCTQDCPCCLATRPGWVDGGVGVSHRVGS